MNFESERLHLYFYRHLNHIMVTYYFEFELHLKMRSICYASFFLAELCLKLTTDISMLLLQSVCEILYQTVLKVWNLMFHIKCILNLFLLKLYTQYTLVNSSWVCNNLSPSYIVLLYQCIILNFVCIMQFVSWLHLYKILIWMMIPFSLDFTH